MMAYLMLMDHHILPHEYDALPVPVKAFLFAAYQKQAEDRERAQKEIEKRN